MVETGPDLSIQAGRALEWSNVNSSLTGAQMKILEKIFKRKCETTVIYHVVFRQKKISKRNLNLHAPFWDISNPDLSRLNYFEWFWMVRIPNAKIVYQNPKSHFTKESTPIKRILLFPIRSENFWNFTYKIFIWYFLLSFFEFSDIFIPFRWDLQFFVFLQHHLKKVFYDRPSLDNDLVTAGNSCARSLSYAEIGLTW